MARTLHAQAESHPPATVVVARIAQDALAATSQWLKRTTATFEFESEHHLRRWLSGLHNQLWSKHHSTWQQYVSCQLDCVAMEPLLRALLQDVLNSPEWMATTDTLSNAAVTKAVESILTSLKPKQTKAPVLISTMPSAAAYVTAVQNTEQLLRLHNHSNALRTLPEVIASAAAELPVV
eukprot:TRINITY_DN9396_c0_g1_i4.p1 TRINITY_DN9396_c0_g1~~TRINITY_DN9396_c0_g1_i4.p1  ORF type:complete len:179 (+),score=33.25 TRINITY_DN9396_c0_g1_i4:84-620(+)